MQTVVIYFHFSPFFNKNILLYCSMIKYIVSVLKTMPAIPHAGSVTSSQVQCIVGYAFCAVFTVVQ